MNPLHVVIYGSSLFLSALVASLRQVPELKLIPAAPEARLADVLRHDPDVMLYQADVPPAYLDDLLAAGVCCGELDTQHSSIVIRQGHHSQEVYSIMQARDLLAAIAAKE